MTPTVNIALDKRYKIKAGPDAGKYHAKIWVTFIRWVNGKKDWAQQPYKTNVFATEEEFAAMMENDPKKKTRIERLKALRDKLDDERSRARDIIKTYSIVDQKQFDLYYLTNHKPEQLAFFYQVKINELLSAKPEPKLSNAEKYGTSLRSLQEFFGPHVTFHDCTSDRLLDYEEWFISQDRHKSDAKHKHARKRENRKKSLATVGIYLRPLRHIFRRAIKAGVIPAALYPFGLNDNEYAIPEGGGEQTKEYLETHDKDLFLNHVFSGWKCSNERCGLFFRNKGKKFPACPRCRAGQVVPAPDDRYNELHDYAVFSYLGFGMNAADIFRLRRSQLKTDSIVFVRKKAKSRKKKRAKLHEVPLHPTMREIINRRGTFTIGMPDALVFPILNDAMTPREVFMTVRKYVRDIDDMLAHMARHYGWHIMPTLYTLRHTFSNEFMEMGGTTEELQDALGHELIRTTEHYKHGFRLAKKKKFSQGLG